jgi:hypothetical protein
VVTRLVPHEPVRIVLVPDEGRLHPAFAIPLMADDHPHFILA